MARGALKLLSRWVECSASASPRENEQPVAYPRACPVCAINYGATGATDRGHVTLRSDPGGTPSPWRPKQPGRILTLKCMTCSDDFVWDYFGSSIVAQRGGSGMPEERHRF
jgi:hypothetical protein